MSGAPPCARRFGRPMPAPGRGLARTSLMLMFLGGPASVQAAFEIRPSGEFRSPLLPPQLPRALALYRCAPAATRTAWAIGALHMLLEPEAGLLFDAVGLRVDRHRWAGRAGVTRLGLPGYSEWTVEIGASSSAGPVLDLTLFRTQPCGFVRDDAGIEPRSAASLGASWARALRPGVMVMAWVRDFARRGDDRALGIEQRAGCRLDYLPVPSVAVALLREWGGSRSGPRTRLELTWRPASAWCLAHARGANSGGESTAVQAEHGNLVGTVWSGRPARGIPPATGVAVGLQQVLAMSGPEEGPRHPKSPRSGSELPERALPAVGGSDWERAPGEDRLIIDGAVVPSGWDSDSLGASADSLDDVISEEGGGEMAPPAPITPAPVRRSPAETTAAATPPEADPGAAPALRTVPWPRLRAADLPVVEGVDTAERERFIRLVRSVGPRAVADSCAANANPVLRRLLLETAPYASAAPSPSPFRGVESIQPRAALWSREYRCSQNGRLRASDRWELHTRPSRLTIHAAGRRTAGVDLRDGSWMAMVEAEGVRLVAGRGSSPLTWGSGLWLRSRALEVRASGSQPAGERRESAGLAASSQESTESPGAASIRGSALAPSSAGRERVAAGEVWLGSGAARLAAMVSPGRTWVAWEQRARAWSGGIIAAAGRAGTRVGVLASHVGSGMTHQVEAGVEGPGPLRLVARSAGAAYRSARGRVWWDLEARTAVPRPRGRAGTSGGEDRASPDRRVRLRGSAVGARLQGAVAIEAWEDGVGLNLVDTPRAGRSLQLRSAMQPRAGLNLVMRATASDGRTVRETDGAQRTRATRRARVSTTASRGRPVGNAGALAEWSFDAAYERRESRTAPSAAVGWTVREGHWVGCAARICFGRRGEASLGLLDVAPPAGGSLQVTPGWNGGGSGFSTTRGGLWCSARWRGRLGWLHAEGRGAWPVLLSRDRLTSAHPFWALTIRLQT